MKKPIAVIKQLLPNGTLAIVGGTDLTKNTSLTLAETLALLNAPCPVYDYQSTPICYTNGVSNFEGTKVVTYQLTTDTGLPDLTTAVTTYYTAQNAVLDITTVTLVNCGASADIEQKEVCVQNADGTFTKGILHTVYTVSGASYVTTGSFFTDANLANRVDNLSTLTFVTCPQLLYETVDVSDTIVPADTYIIADYHTLNDRSHLQEALTNGTISDYGYRVTSVVVNGVAQLISPISTTFTLPNLQDVPVQVAPYDTVPEHDTLEFQYDKNFVDLLNGLNLENIEFRPSPVSESAKIGLNDYQNNIVITTLSPIFSKRQLLFGSSALYGDGLQVSYPSNYSFSIAIECLYDGVVEHTQVIDNTGTTIDGSLVIAQAPGTKTVLATDL